MGWIFPRNINYCLNGEGREIKSEIRAVAKELFQKQFPQHFVYKEEIPRVIFLSYFWYNFHTLAKYGINNIPPDKLFKKEEAELALKHAKYCVEVANGLLIYRKDEERR